MATIVLNYSALSITATTAGSLAKAVSSYADNLSKKVSKQFSGVDGGSSDYLNNANYYVNQKIGGLKDKADKFSNYCTQMKNFVETAKRVDGNVKKVLKQNQETFLKGNEHLRIPEWKADILNFLTDLKNKNFLFNAIATAIQSLGDKLSDMFANIKYWYKLEGGKEKLQVILAFAGVVVAVCLFIAALPALAAISSIWAGVVAWAGVIGAFIAGINAIVNLVTSCVALYAAEKGDPAWAKIYGEQDSLSDVIQETNFGSAKLNNLMDKVSTVIEIVNIACSVITIIDGLGKIASKVKCIDNYFNEKSGLKAFCKEAEWTEIVGKNPVTGQWYLDKVMKVDDAGNVVTKYTPQSVMKGLKAYFTNDSRVTNTGEGLRTMLNKNFKIDFTDFRKSFSLQGIKETFQYNASQSRGLNILKGIAAGDTMDANQLSWYKNAWKSLTNDYKLTSFKELKNLKNYAGQISAGMNITEKIGSVIDGKYDLGKDIHTKITGEVISWSGNLQLVDKIGALKKITETIGIPSTGTSGGLMEKSSKMWDSISSLKSAYGYSFLNK